MKKYAVQFITLLCLGYFSFILGSCCRDDKNCPAASPALGNLPYSPNELLVFKDVTGRTISVKLNGAYNYSTPYAIEGKCGMMQKDDKCAASKSLSASAIIDSPAFLKNYEQGFNVSIQEQQLTNSVLTQYYLNAFETAFFFGNYQNNDIQFTNATAVQQYQTPHKVYPLVYSFINKHAYGTNKTIVSPTGRLISFTLLADTTHTFYAVE